MKRRSCLGAQGGCVFVCSLSCHSDSHHVRRRKSLPRVKQSVCFTTQSQCSFLFSSAALTHMLKDKRQQYTDTKLSEQYVQPCTKITASLQHICKKGYSVSFLALRRNNFLYSDTLHIMAAWIWLF